MARVRFTIIDGMLAFLSCKALLTNATKVVYIIDALTSINAGIGITIINVDVAHVTYPSRLTDTPEREKISITETMNKKVVRKCGK